MAQKKYDNDGTGVLFINKTKKSENSPTMLGRITIDGAEYWLSAWSHDHEKYGRYLSIALGDEVEEKPKPKGRSNKRAKKEEEIDDDIPF